MSLILATNPQFIYPFSALTISERNAIPTSKRKFGQLVTVWADGTIANNRTYILANAANGGVDNDVSNNANWILYGTSTLLSASGGGGGSVTSVGLSMPGIFSVTGSPITTNGTFGVTLASQAINTIFAGPSNGSSAAPTFRSLVTADLPDAGTPVSASFVKITTDAKGRVTATTAVTAGDITGTLGYTPGTGSVTSVALSLPATFTLSGSPITSAGTFTAAWANQSINTIFAGPSSGSSAAPTFRSLVTADLPDAGTPVSASFVKITTDAKGRVTATTAVTAGDITGTLGYTPGTGTVTSVALSLPATFTLSGSPITSAGTITATWANQSINTIFAGPSSGSSAAPTFRSLVTADLPDAGTPVSASFVKITTDAKGRVTATTAVTAGDITGTLGYTPGTGSVTSISLTMPNMFIVAGSPVTTSGTFGVTLANQSPNLIFAGPSSGGGAVPTFRSLVTADLPDVGIAVSASFVKITTDAKGRVTATTAVTAGDITGALGYTPGTGSVTSVTGTGTVSGITLTGTVTTSGNLTLGGTISGLTTANLSATAGITNAQLAGSIAASKLIGTDIATVGTITTGTWNAGAVTSSGAITGTKGIFNGGNEEIKLIATPNVTYGSANYMQWYRADGTTARSYIGYGSGNDQRFQLGTFEVGGVTEIYSGNGNLTLSLSSAGNATVSGYVDASSYRMGGVNALTYSGTTVSLANNSFWQTINLVTNGSTALSLASNQVATFGARINGVVGGTAYNTAGLWLQGSNSTDGIAIGGTGGGAKTVDTYGGTLNLNLTTGNGTLIGGTLGVASDISLTHATQPQINFSTGATNRAYIYATNAHLVLNSTTGNDILLQNNGTTSLTISAAGDFNFGSWASKLPSANTTYRQSFFGGLSVLFRDAEDSYINSNHSYNSSGQNIANYTSSSGIGRLDFVGGNLTWSAYNGSVTAGSAYSLSTVLTITKSGNATFSSSVNVNNATNDSTRALNVNGRTWGEGSDVFNSDTSNYNTIGIQTITGTGFTNTVEVIQSGAYFALFYATTGTDTFNTRSPIASIVGRSYIGGSGSGSKIAGVWADNLFQSTKNITTAASFWAAPAYQQSGQTAYTGTITNYCGIYIEDMTGGSNISSKITNKYGIYQVGTSDINYFGGEIRLGSGQTVSASTTNTITNKIKLIINGTTYYLLASTSNA